MYVELIGARKYCPNQDTFLKPGHFCVSSIVFWDTGTHPIKLGRLVTLSDIGDCRLGIVTMATSLTTFVGYFEPVIANCYFSFILFSLAPQRKPWNQRNGTQ